MGHLLEVKNLKTHFQMHDHLVKAVDGIDFHLDRGEVLGIVGESGCGKSMTSMSIMRLIPEPPGKIVDGSILFEGEDIVQASDERMREIRGNNISMIFQEPMTSLNPVFTIGNQISEVLILHRKMTEEEALAESVKLLGMVGISDPEERVHEYPFQLSGGLRQRVMIAMALACEPSIIIADEPTTALDVTIQAQILRLMGELKDKINSSIIFITHDLAVIAEFADRVAVMYSGVIVESTTVKEIFESPKHPYTQGLLASVPVLGQKKINSDGTPALLETIPGSLPDPKFYPTGCRFAARCKFAEDRCSQKEPELLEYSKDHKVRCYLTEDELQAQE